MRVSRSLYAYFTTPIFYVNAKPHIGHLHSMVLADAAHRWEKFMGRKSAMLTGTDEHGSKVAAAAAKANKSPLEFVNQLSQSFKELADRADIDYARFMRTTDKDHIDTARRIWSLLQEKGYIYKGTHQGWYCLSDETFYPESELESTPEGFKSKESGNEVQWYEETNYFFALSKMQQQLIDLFKSRPDFVQPPARHRQLLAELESQPLQDLSISRPANRCPWGIPVPGDESQTMYVWFEALINYYTAVNDQCVWPATHIVGKDIIRFHAIYWPAFLLAAGIDTPKQVIVHNHWTLEGTKMSKSKNNVVDPMLAIDEYGLDTLRYFLLGDASLDHDTPFSAARVTERHNVNLVNKLGNLVSRVCGEKFDIPASLKAVDVATLPHAAYTSPLLDQFEASIGRFEFSRALLALNDAVMDANQAFQDAAPWAAEPAERARAVAMAADSLRIFAIVLLPICPEYASRILDRLAVHPDKRTHEYARAGADLDFGVGANRKGDPVLQRLPSPELP